MPFEFLAPLFGSSVLPPLDPDWRARLLLEAAIASSGGDLAAPWKRYFELVEGVDAGLLLGKYWARRLTASDFGDGLSAAEMLHHFFRAWNSPYATFMQGNEGFGNEWLRICDEKKIEDRRIQNAKKKARKARAAERRLAGADRDTASTERDGNHGGHGGTAGSTLPQRRGLF